MFIASSYLGTLVADITARTVFGVLFAEASARSIIQQTADSDGDLHNAVLLYIDNHSDIFFIDVPVSKVRDYIEQTVGSLHYLFSEIAHGAVSIFRT